MGSRVIKQIVTIVLKKKKKHIKGITGAEGRNPKVYSRNQGRNSYINNFWRKLQITPFS